MRPVKVHKRYYIFRYGKLEKMRCLRCGRWLKPDSQKVRCTKCGLTIKIDATGTIVDEEK